MLSRGEQAETRPLRLDTPLVFHSRVRDQLFLKIQLISVHRKIIIEKNLKFPAGHLILKLVDLPLETIVDGRGEQHTEALGVMFMSRYGAASIVRVFHKLLTFLIDEEGVVDVGHLAVLAKDNGQRFVAVPSESVFHPFIDEFRRVAVQEQLTHIIFPDDLIARHSLAF